MKNNETPVLSIRNLKQHFKTGDLFSKFVVKAVDDISFDIYKGETLGLVGESGCGKTTTGRSIINIYNITDGEIYFEGVKIAQGTLSFKEEIKRIKEDANVKLNENLKKIKQINIETKNANAELANAEIDILKKENIKIINHRRKEISKLRAKIRAARKLNSENKHFYDKIQMVFQDPIASLNPRMTVKEIIAEGLRIHGEKDEEVINTKVANILEIVGLLPEHASRYPHEFSGGQRQRIGVARALIIKPEVLIADEPISALDVSIQAQVINLLNDLRRELGLTVLFIAHDLSVVKYFSDRIAVMYYGKIVELADSAELFKNPLHPYTKSLLSAIPIPDPKSERKRQRIHYNSSVHNYNENNKPSLVEIKPGHFISASPQELEEYKKNLK